MEYHAAQKIIDFAKKWGARDFNVWVKVIQYFGSRGAQDEAHLRAVLGHIERAQLLPPLMVVQLLGSAELECQVGVVRDYLIRYFESIDETVASSEQTIDEYHLRATSIMMIGTLD
jgi:hypothetical protein